MDAATSNKPIIVGYGQSPQSDQAVRWAVDAAARHTAPVEVIHILDWPVTTVPGDIDWLSGDQRLAIQTEVETAARRITGQALSVSIMDGPIVRLLCELSADARMIVLGSHGSGTFADSLLGSRTLSVATHASCPVIVVRGTEHPQPEDLPIIVGVDGSPESVHAAHFAFAEASVRKCEVIAIRAWHPEPDLLEELQTAERHQLRQVLHSACLAYPEVPFTLKVTGERPAKALIEASQQARLVVVGSRGMSGFKGLLLGSVRHRLLHHAYCPVAIVR